MIRKLLILLFPLLLIVFVPRTNAQTATTGSAQTTIDPATKLKQQIQMVQGQKKTVAEQAKNDLETLTRMKRAELKARISTIKDETKKALMERIDARLAGVNKNQTTKFIDTLNKLQVFVDRANKTTTATDTAKLRDIGEAQEIINFAKQAVLDQAEKTYIMTIINDSTLRANAGTTVSQFRHDLMAVYKLVMDAKQAVQKLYLSNVNKETIRKEATNSARL
jgi:hypothetical protein